jgi:hypothetical protein
LNLGPVTDGKTIHAGAPIRLCSGEGRGRPRDVGAAVRSRYPAGLAGLTPAELAALAAADPAGWQSAQARAAALAGGRS